MFSKNLVEIILWLFDEKIMNNLVLKLKYKYQGLYKYSTTK